MNRSTMILLGMLVLLPRLEAAVSSNGAGVSSGLLYVDVYDRAQACNGTTLLPVGGGSNSPHFVELNMRGDIVWEYIIPTNLQAYVQPGNDAELLTNGNILCVFPGAGLYELDRAGSVVWTYLDPDVSHDADRLTNGNTLMVFGDDDRFSDAQVKEVDAQGNLVWSWKASNYFFTAPYTSLFSQGWTHCNAASRLTNGNTLISLRNFNLTLEVNPQGVPVWSQDWSQVVSVTSTGGFMSYDPHEPVLLTNDHLLVCLQSPSPVQVVELDRATRQLVWQYTRPEGLRTPRDSNRLRNGNTLILGVLTNSSQESSVLFEVTPQSNIVWELKIKNTPANGSPGYFFKVERLYHDNVRGDFDGDGASDLPVFDSASGRWFVSSVSGDTIVYNQPWGWPGATPVSADFNGDGTDNLAVFDGATGRWYLPSRGLDYIAWGQAGDIPVPGDYDGDAKTDYAVYGASGAWYIISSTGELIAWATAWGWSGAIPVPGDYDGDGVNDLAVFEESSGAWFIYSLRSGILEWNLTWGWPGAAALSGDYDGDDIDDVAVYDTTTGLWFIWSLSGDVVAWGTVWGVPGAQPVSGDFDGDGISDLAVFDPATGRWYIRSMAGDVLAWAYAWGWSGATAVTE